ncbi:RE1 [Symbiodinium sp. CCMP2592]|nr:RE1 [Symbiodinium sp. CCMP2592]
MRNSEAEWCYAGGYEDSCRCASIDVSGGDFGELVPSVAVPVTNSAGRDAVRGFAEFQFGTIGSSGYEMGGGSDSSASFTKEQLEQEVKRQVDQAMQRQRGVADENVQLRAEIERLQREAEATRVQAGMLPVRAPLGDRGAQDGMLRGTPEGPKGRSSDGLVSEATISVFMVPHQAAILEDPKRMMESKAVKGFWVFVEYFGAIHQDFLDVIVNKGAWDGQGLGRDAAVSGGDHGKGGDGRVDRDVPEWDMNLRSRRSGRARRKLEEADEMAAINVADWLHGLSGPMGDLTDGSAQWWAQVVSSLESYYHDYINATAVKKLQMRADDYASSMLKEARWLRVDKRVASMLLQAVPDAIRTEILANRLQSTLAILARIMTIYRPGSAVERQQVLKALEAPGPVGSPMELVECLRKWARWLKRAQDLVLQVPDPSILLKGLDQSAKAQLEKNQEVMFRSNMLRYSLELDARPTLASVTTYHSHLLGEFEQIAYRGRSRAGPTSTPTIKAMGSGGNDGAATSPKGAPSPTSTSSTTAKPCKFFVSEAGCQRGNCKFSHDWASIPREERNERCKACGAKGHMRKNCPVKASATDPPRRDDGKGGQPRLRPMGKGGDGKRDDGTVPPSSSTTTSAPTTTTGPPTSAAASMSGSLDSASSASGGPSVSEAGGAPRDVDDFLRNATQILKMMTEQQNAARPSPSLKMLKKAILKYEDKMALVDSGATHPLKIASAVEWECSPEVDVVVAGDEVKRMRQNKAGTLLLEPSTERSQTIVPVGNLIGILGYEMVWSRRKCFLRSPEGKELPMKIASGCPEVNEATALELIAKIEEEKLREFECKAESTKNAMMRARDLQQDPMWEKSMKAYVTEGKFDDGFRALASAPWAAEHLRLELSKVASDLPKSEGEAWQLMQQLGFNRRMRKRMMNKDWIVKLCSGRRSTVDKVFKVLESNGTMVLDIDFQRLPQLDLLKAGPGVMMMLLWGAATGRVAAVVGGLPKHNAEDHVVRAVSLYEVATAGRKEMREAIDIPFDGVAFSLWASAASEEDESSTTWDLAWFRRWVAEGHMNIMHFDQGGLGHPLRRPTSMATNLDVVELKGIQDQRVHEECEKGPWSSWAPMLARILARGLKRWKLRPGWYPRLVKALKAVDRRSWEQHLSNDHLPYRPDCLQCIHNATGRPHRKCLHRDCYVMSADTLGPVRVAGPKGERFAVVFTYQFPKQKMVAEDHLLPEEELDGWNLGAKGKMTTAVGEEELDYSPDEGEDPELSPGELDELRRVQQQRPGEEEESEVVPMVEKLKAKAKESSEDWWEFRETAGVLIRLDYTRVTEVQYAGGGVETETSDWHGTKSGARALEREWTGRTTFRISTAEIPEEEDELKKDEETWEKLIGDITKPVEMDTIYMVYPVRSRRGGDIMLAVQEAIDRGSEFASKGLRKWLLDRDIYHTRSEALVPQTNGAAERGVRWFKTMAKVLMAEAGVGTKFWTLAMQHAANRRIYERLGIERPKLLNFGAKVMIRRKVFGNNKKFDLTDRWEEGTYLGLSDTIKGGAIVLRPSGVITETLNLKLDVVDPHVLLAEPPESEKDEGVGVGEMGVKVVPVVDLPDPARKGLKHFYNMGKFDLESCAEVLREVQLGKSKYQTRGETSTLVLGAYVHGGMRGATLASRKRPWLTSYLNMVLGQRTVETTGREPAWTTLGVFKAKDIPPHRDLRNQPGSENFVMEVSDKEIGGLWLSTDDQGEASDGFHGVPLRREFPDGSVKEGMIMDITERVAVFDPKKTHSYVNAEGSERWIIAGFTPLGVEMLQPEPLSFLNMCKFPLDRTGLEVHTVQEHSVEGFASTSELSDDDDDDGLDEDELEQKARVLRCALQEEQDCPGDVAREEGFQQRLEHNLWECERELHWFESRARRRIMKVSPGEAKDVEVERLLDALVVPPEVVHNVSLPEIKKYLDRWKPAILKEVAALIDSGTVRRLTPEQTKELKKDGLIVLPGKAVFTAKPPTEGAKGGERFRRKCRIVVCGNFLPDRELNVYASGTSSDSLRIAVAYAVRRSWTAGCTDVSNAFTLAPMSTDRLYAVSPPTIVLLAGGAVPGETWLIERVLYGLREAPRLWGCFRNERLATARIEYDGKIIVLRSLTTDENMWKLCVEDDESQTPLGLMLVYVDDILILSIKALVLTVYQWLIQDWKCSALEWIDEGYIRFLGIELRVCGEGVHLSQAGYVRDLLRQHGVPEQPEAGLTVPCQREWLQDDSDEEAPVPDEAAVKMAQKATGEALWLSTRSRPELTHAVACMASYALRRPLKSLEISKRILKYLARTVDYGIWYQMVKDDPLLVVYSDASYAPGGGRSFGSTMAQVAGMPVAWRSAKQPVITLSVAEAELYEGISAVQLGLGVGAMLSELEECGVMHLRIDNAAAQGLASEAPGSWKTRHLRVRARYLRQEVSAQRLVISHVCGSEQKADLGTKGFDLPKFKMLMELWRIIPCTADGVANVAVKSLKIANGKGVLMFILMCLLLVKGVGGPKEDLSLDGSFEFYGVALISLIAGVAVWECIKGMWGTATKWWSASQRKQKRLERSSIKGENSDVEHTAKDENSDAEHTAKYGNSDAKHTAEDKNGYGEFFKTVI